MAIRLNMLSRMVRNDFHPRTRNGQPHQSTTGVARTSSSQRAVPSPIQAPTGSPSIGPMAMTRSGTVSTAPTAKPPPEVDQLRVRPLVRRRHPLRLQRHAADRAVPRPHLLDLGMHRAGVDRPRRHRLRRRPPARYFPGSASNFALQPAGAEVEPLARVPRHVPRRRPVHLHPAHRVGRRRRSVPGPRRTSPGTPRCRSGKRARHARAAACPHPGRRSSRRPDPAPPFRPPHPCRTSTNRFRHPICGFQQLEGQGSDA